MKVSGLPAATETREAAFLNDSFIAINSTSILRIMLTLVMMYA
jgi:hypothetical protein